MTTNKRFPLGVLMQTPGSKQVDFGHIMMCLAKHAAGDWGVVDAADKAANNAALRDGDRLLSAYLIDEQKPELGKFWIITEADRSLTTVLLPEEY
jgi:hypothetical protein